MGGDADTTAAAAASTLKRRAEEALARDDPPCGAAASGQPAEQQPAEAAAAAAAQPDSVAATPGASPLVSPEAAPAPHPWAGTWDLHSNEACATGVCKDPLCRAVIPGVCIMARNGLLSATNFSLKALEDPMSEDPFSYPDPAYLTYEQAAAAGGASFVWHGDDTGCGVKSVTCKLHFTADPAAGGAPARIVRLHYDVQLGPLYTRKGHQSWDGQKQLIKISDAEPAAAAAA